jgi:hypothetical protein
MKPEPLLAAFGKVEWAITQIDQLNRQINAFFANNPYRLVPNVEADSPRIEPIKVWRIRHSKQIPGPIYSQVGVVLGLLREPLDQVVSATCRHRGKSESGQGFVFGETREKFEAALEESKKIPRDVRDLIAETEPFFDGGGHLLAALHYLKNPDKHRSPLVPIMLDTAINMKDIKAYNGPIFTIGPRRGVHMRRDPLTNNMVQSDPNRQPDTISKTAKVGWCSGPTRTPAPMIA